MQKKSAPTSRIVRDILERRVRYIQLRDPDSEL